MVARLCGFGENYKRSVAPSVGETTYNPRVGIWPAFITQKNSAFRGYEFYMIGISSLSISSFLSESWRIINFIPRHHTVGWQRPLSATQPRPNWFGMQTLCSRNLRSRIMRTDFCVRIILSGSFYSRWLAPSPSPYDWIGSWWGLNIYRMVDWCGMCRQCVYDVIHSDTDCNILISLMASTA